METSYHAPANNVNSILTAPLRDLLNLLRDLSKKHGYSWARNEWLAQRLNCTPRTITRQIAALIRAGYISARRVANERHISIEKKPDEKRIKYTLRKPDTPAEMSTRCLPASIEGETKENNIPKASTEAAPGDVVDSLKAHGVSAIVAERLAASNPDECRHQLDAIKNRTGTKKPAAWIVAAIKGAWRHTTKKHDAPTVQVKRYAASPPQPAAPPQNDAETAYEALSDSEKQRIAEQITPTLPAIARRSRYIIRAACIKHLEKTLDTAAPPGKTTAAPS